MSQLIILPHQLFSINYFPVSIKSVILYEHPQYFTKYNFNKKKLVLHRASMKCYKDYLVKNDFKVKYINFNQKEPSFKDKIIFDPVDNINFNVKPKEILETPNFLLTKEDYGKIRKKSDKFFFKSFYASGKKINDIIPNIKSQDKQNRQRMPKDLVLPKIPLQSKEDSKYVNEAIKYVNKNFPDNYGNTDNFWCPISYDSAKKWFKEFIKKKFSNFGPYQDFIKQGEQFMFHSVLSCVINIGLINPLEIIKEIKPLQKKVPINSFEGYVRQLYWREYQRYCFIYCPFDSNYFGNSKKLSKDWYEGTLGIPPVDDAIKTAFDLGYLHHINRLMVVGNYMNLSEIEPMEGLKWFMEFSVDSYEWVMYQNVLDMVFFVTGGKTMRKPYSTSSNYVLKMSDYKKDEWCETWNQKYEDFMKNNVEKLWNYRYSFPGLKKYKKN